MRFSFNFLVLILFVYSTIAFAQGGATVSCSKDGYTIATINGVFTDERGAQNNKKRLEQILGKTLNGQPLKVDYLLNPSHAGGLSDLVEVAVQKMLDNRIVDTYDLTEMISSASEKVQTQKLLLVAHSQGNFYANSFYDSVVKTKDGGDIPPESMGVYSVATPSNRVAGGGSWITSDTDKVIAGLVGHIPLDSIMKPNTHIVLSKEDDPMGHSFGDVYLKYRGAEIVSGIYAALDKLKDNDVQSELKPCIVSPPKTLVHRLTGVVFAVADPLANFSEGVVVGAATGAYKVGAFAVKTTVDTAALSINTGVAIAKAAVDVSTTVARASYNGTAALISGLGNILSGSQNSAAVAQATSQNAPANVEVIPVLESGEVASQNSFELPKPVTSPISIPTFIPKEVLRPAAVERTTDVVELPKINLPTPAVSMAAIGNVSAPQIAPANQELTASSPQEPAPYVFISSPIPDSHPIPSGGGSIASAPAASPADTTAPGAVSDLSATDATLNSIKLNWTAQGDDNASGTASSYDVRYSTSLITDANWLDATKVIGEPEPSIAGTAQSLTVSDLSASTTYFFAIKITDESSNTSLLSNIASASTLTLPPPPDTTSPGAVTDLRVSDVSQTSVGLLWTSVGDDGGLGTASGYDLRYGVVPITTENFNDATQVGGLSNPQIAGSSESASVSGLSASTTYYFAIKVFDEVSNRSDLSNIVSQTTSQVPPPPDTTAPDTPVILSPDSSSTTFASAHVTFSGTAEVGSDVHANISGSSESQVSTRVLSDGTWSIALDLSEGLNQLEFSAVDSSGNISSLTRRTLTIDTTPPIVTLSVAQCEHSISSSSCVLLSPNVNISWTANEDVDHYVISKNGIESTISATSTTVTISNDSSYTFSVYAVDLVGNKSTTVNKVINVSSVPVVINEVAWGGTPSHPEDEWIELYNRSSQSIDLSGFTLYSKTDNGPYIQLSGTIASGAYFLVEAKNSGETDQATQAPIKNVTPGMWVDFGNGLSDNGENVALSYASSTIDEIPYCFKWCGVPSTRTTERYDPDSTGNSSSNWSSNNADIINGQNVSGSAITGTPGARNSLNYLINKGSNVSSNLTLTKKYSPYLVDNITQTIAQGSTLNIEPGVVIKFRNAARLAVDGNIVASGTASDPIVFTAFADDSYGGNIDGVVATPTKGSWYGVELSNKSTGSSFDHTLFRYGANYSSGGSYKKAMLYVTGVSPQISNSTFEYSKAYGAYLSSTNSSISNNVFQYNTGDTFSAGLYIDQGAPTVNNNTFTQNTLGVYVNSSTGTFTNNTFGGNTIAMQVGGPLMGTFTGNSGGSGDHINLLNSISVSGATTTLYANPMPYFLQGTVTVVSGSTLDIREGTVIENYTLGSPSVLSVNGKLNIDTSSNTGVIFRSSQSNPTKTSWPGISMNSGSSSHIKGATIRDASNGIKYTSSPIWLENVDFENNTTAVWASLSSVLRAVGVTFSGNTTDKNPSNLW